MLSIVWMDIHVLVDLWVHRLNCASNDTGGGTASGALFELAL
jgi:hypothetical protein